MITRREFVCSVGCCAAIAKNLSGQTANAPKDASKDASKKEGLVAPCGLYCGACAMYLATQENNPARLTSRFGSSPKQQSAKPPALTENMMCDGCGGGGRTPAHVPKCAIKLCAAEKTKTGRCADCAEFPCSRITEFNNDGMAHHSEVLGNLRQLREVGIKEWAKREEERWQCTKCQTKIAWYEAECIKCKTPRPSKLFPLSKA